MAEPLRLAFWHTELSRKGPGLLLADITKGKPDVAAALATLTEARADILILAGIDHDHGLVTLTALRDALGAGGGPDYPHVHAPRPNTGHPTGLDLNGDGKRGGPQDAQGYGRFAGQEGLAVLSRHPLTLTADHSTLLWRDMPDSLIIDHTGQEGAMAVGANIQRLASVAHVELAVTLPDQQVFTVMVFHAGPPVFDGPEDRNGRRNHDEVIFWKHRLDGAFGPPPAPPFALIGAANLDPGKGDGRSIAIQTLLQDPRLTDPPNLRGKPTVTWPDPGPGEMRVDYILPSQDLLIRASGILTARPGSSRHNLIWVDLEVHAATATPAPSGN
jgi:hypothetical protein